MYKAFALYLIFASVSANQNHVGNKVGGDQTVGGIHLFELHAPGGGIGLGIKIMLIGGLVLALLYWYMRRQTIRAIRRTAYPYPATEMSEIATTVAPALRGRPACGPACRRHEEEATSSVRLP